MKEREMKFESATLERIIVAYLLRDKSFFLKVAKHLKTPDWNKKSYFLDPKLQWLLNSSIKFYEKYSSVPSSDTLKIVIEKKYSKEDELLASSLNKIVEEIYGMDLKQVDAEFIKEETVKFITTMKAYEATIMNQLDISNGKFDMLDKRMREATSLNLDRDLGISLANTEEVMNLIKEVDEQSGLTFGSPALDRILGSPRAGELTVLCGTPGIGKTIWLGNVATENMKLGKKGVFFSLEVDRKRLARRLYSSLLMKSGCDVANTSKEEIDAIFSQFNDGDIKIKNFPAHTASCNDFANYLMELYTAEGFKPDFIVIDYILITATNSKEDSDNMYSYYKTVSEEMRNLGVMFECPVFTAAQINREGMGEKGGTKGMVTSRNLSESRGILDTADYCLVINQTDSEKKMGETDGISEQRLYIDKNRNGATGEILTFTLNYNMMSIIDGKKRRIA